MICRNIVRTFHTIRYLKVRQLVYRSYYILRKKYLPIRLKALVCMTVDVLSFSQFICKPKSFEKYSFKFLNLSVNMKKEHILWDADENGLLWVYNLNYFDFLMQSGMNTSTGLDLVSDFVKNIGENSIGLEPYPTSIRGMNWIKYFSTNAINIKTYNDSLFSQYELLTSQIEYHLLGNHLLENGISLLFAAYYFRNDAFYKIAYKILIKELKEQIHNDGGHFELSPMYHQIILERILDSINLLKNNKWKKDGLLDLLVFSGIKMLSWLNTITFSDGMIPMVNDSTFKISSATNEINNYAKCLGIEPKSTVLSDSGYRKISIGKYEIVVDIGNIGPNYIPGHAHSDTFNFILYIDGSPIITEVGTSTYEKNILRTEERSTGSHNTVKIDKTNSSDVWGGFRVGRRAFCKIEVDTNSCIVASHNGYKNIGVVHRRSFLFKKNGIEISDALLSKKKRRGQLYLHFHPNVAVEIHNNAIFGGTFTIKFIGAKHIEQKHYYYSKGYNLLEKSNFVEVLFDENIQTSIKIIDT